MQHLNECKVLSWEPLDVATLRGGPVWSVAPVFQQEKLRLRTGGEFSKAAQLVSGSLPVSSALLPVSVLPCVLWVIKASVSVTPEGRRQAYWQLRSPAALLPPHCQPQRGRVQRAAQLSPVYPNRACPPVPIITPALVARRSPGGADGSPLPVYGGSR